LAEHLDMILRDHELRLTMHLVIVKDASCGDVMNVTGGGINTIPSSYIEDLVKQYKVHSTSVDSKVLDFLKSYHSKGINPIVTVLKKVRKDKVGKSEREEYELSVEGAAVFLKDRLVGFLDGPETRGYNWVIGKVSSGVVTFPTPNSNGLTSVEILQAGSKRDVEISGNDIRIKVKINMNGMLDEQTTNIELTDPEVIEILEQANSQALKQEVEHTLLKVQKEYKSDVFGFGQIVHRKYPQEWKNMQDNWDELFSQATIEVETEAKITKTGKSTLPVKE
jgi:germination protein, Ger(x)C family